MCGLAPCEESNHLVLEDKDYTDSAVLSVDEKKDVLGDAATHLALKRLKLVDMAGRLKDGRSTYSLDRLSFLGVPSSSVSVGKTCSSRLYASTSQLLNHQVRLSTRNVRIEHPLLHSALRGLVLRTHILEFSFQPFRFSLECLTFGSRFRRCRLCWRRCSIVQARHLEDWNWIIAIRDGRCGVIVHDG